PLPTRRSADLWACRSTPHGGYFLPQRHAVTVQYFAGDRNHFTRWNSSSYRRFIRPGFFERGDASVQRGPVSVMVPRSDRPEPVDPQLPAGEVEAGEQAGPVLTGVIMEAGGLLGPHCEQSAGITYESGAFLRPGAPGRCLGEPGTEYPVVLAADKTVRVCQRGGQQGALMGDLIDLTSPCRSGCGVDRGTRALGNQMCEDIDDICRKFRAVLAPSHLEKLSGSICNGR